MTGDTIRVIGVYKYTCYIPLTLQVMPSQVVENPFCSTSPESEVVDSPNNWTPT